MARNKHSFFNIKVDHFIGNWIISKRQKTKKKQAAAISVEACPGLSTKADKLQY